MGREQKKATKDRSFLVTQSWIDRRNMTQLRLVGVPLRYQVDVRGIDIRP